MSETQISAASEAPTLTQVQRVIYLHLTIKDI